MKFSRITCTSAWLKCFFPLRVWVLYIYIAVAQSVASRPFSAPHPPPSHVPVVLWINYRNYSNTQNVRCQFNPFKVLYPWSNPKRLKVQMKFLKKKSKITNYGSGCDGASKGQVINGTGSHACVHALLQHQLPRYSKVLTNALNFILIRTVTGDLLHKSRKSPLTERGF